LSRTLREPVNGLTHLGAALLSSLGLLVLLFLAQGDPTKLASLSIYGITLIMMFSFSALYHLLDAGPRVTLLLRKLDHSAIYLLIAGTYTPICLHYFTGFWRFGFLAVIWSLAFIGIAVKQSATPLVAVPAALLALFIVLTLVLGVPRAAHRLQAAVPVRSAPTTRERW